MRRGFVFSNYQSLNNWNLLLESSKILKQKWHKTTKNGMINSQGKPLIWVIKNFKRYVKNHEKNQYERDFTHSSHLHVAHKWSNVSFPWEKIIYCLVSAKNNGSVGCKTLKTYHFFQKWLTIQNNMFQKVDHACSNVFPQLWWSAIFHPQFFLPANAETDFFLRLRVFRTIIYW